VAEPQRGLFARQLRQLRQDKLMSQRDLAGASGVPFRTINDLERDLHAPRAATVSKLADALGLAGTARASFTEAAKDRHETGNRNAADGDSGRSGEQTRGTGRRAATRTLPRGIASFTGRAAELRQLVDAASAVDDEVAVFAVEGMAGIGKTCLAVRAAHQLARRFPDGQLFLDLHGYTPGVGSFSPEAALRSLLRMLGIPHQAIPRALEDAAALYRSLLADTRTLLVLDNASSTAQVAPLLPGTAGCLVIITSRTELRGLDGVRALHLDAPPEQDAIDLFCAAAGPGRAEPGDPQVAEIVALCEYLPLAVQIVAARVSRRLALPLGDILTELRGERDRLSYLEDTDRNVTAVFQLSFRNLPGPDQQIMFQRLGLIPGPDFDVGAAASLIGADARTTRQHLESLLGHNLLIQHAAGRYRFHDLVRVYARTLNYPAGQRRVQAPGDSAGGARLPDEAADVLGRLLDFYVAAAQAADQCLERRIPPLPQPAVVTRPRALPLLDTAARGKTWISAELANLDAAAQYAVRFFPARAVALSSALAQYLSAYGPWPLALALHQGALDAARRLRDAHGQARALAQMGSVQRRSGDLGSAEDALEQALDLYRGLTDPLGQAAALLEIGVVRRLNGSITQATQDLEQALERYGQQDAALGRAATLAEIGAAQRQEGQFAAAQDSLGQALRLYRELSSRPGEAAVLGYLGSLQLTTGELKSAERSLTSALKLNRDLDEPIGQANNLLLLGIAYRDSGKPAQAKKSLDDAMIIYGKLGDRRGRAGAQAMLGSLHLLTGHHEQADQYLTQALELFQELNDRGGAAETLNHSGALALAVGSPGEARARYEQARKLAREIGSLKDEADALEGIGSGWLADAEPGQSVPYLREALDLYTKLGCHADAGRVRATLEGLADQEP
jgi:tetratricopeptide (TPR) repeat protein/transcriptional regulator with XRE-family HTH domain